MFGIEAVGACEVLLLLDGSVKNFGAIAFELKIDEVKEATAVADLLPYSPQTSLKI